jgi:hypothetical protein
MEQREYGPIRSVCRLVYRRFRGCGPIRSGCLERVQLRFWCLADRSDVLRWYPFIGYIRLEAMFDLPIHISLYADVLFNIRGWVAIGEAARVI